MLEQSIQGLIKALRANKNDEARVVEQALEETRKEIQSNDIDLKSAAILKLIYLEMLGYSISFASFAIVECMTSTKFHIKSIGYLAASQCFDRETEVAVLVVNLVKKDLLTPPTPLFSASPNALTVAHLTTALSSVSLLLTPTLARDLGPDLLSLLTHTRPLVRRQAVLTMWRILRSWPGVQELTTGGEERGEDPWIERIRERLSDEDTGVVGATVNVICEAARKDPRKYLPLAPELFGLLTASTNNWMLIKIIKLFAVLTPEEPRLVKKLVPPLTELIETTPAMSLLYECIQTSIVGGMLNGPEGEVLARTCVEKLGAFLEDIDQNLRYIALVALVKIAPTHPHLISTHYDTILGCIDDADMSIRMRALDLVEVMVNRQNLQTIVKRLLTHLRPSASTASAAASLLRAQQAATNGAPATPSTPAISTAYRSSLISLILRMTSRGTYSNVSNFAWLIDTLVELAYISQTLQPDTGCPALTANSPPTVGSQLRDQLIDVTARVRQLRPYAARKMASLIQDEYVLGMGEGGDATEVLGAAAWICGEYCRDLDDPRPVIASLFGSSTTSALPPRILALYVHNGVKIYASWLSTLAEAWDESSIDQIRSITTALENQLTECAKSQDVDLQERAAELHGLLQLVRTGLDTPRSVIESSAATDAPTDEAAGGFAPSNRAPPSSLTLLNPLFFSHELNPVNSKAQSLVTVPEGLDLDVAFNASAWATEDASADEREVEVDEFGRPLRVAVDTSKEVEQARKKKRKSKGVSGKKGKRRDAEEDSEELPRLRAERYERERDDPYHMGRSSSYGPASDEDVDSIPIVNLDIDLRSPPTRTSTPPPREPTPPPMEVDVEGELPPGLAALLAPRPMSPVEPQPEEKADMTAELKESRAAEGAAVKVVKKKKGKAGEGKSTKPRKGKKEVAGDD
ncbi:AP-3 complex subunit delta-1 [Rhodotorula toruloides]|uniref:AP-3 complex subunit delta n=1 Tax=Rhodotorula toruloides TaxID=5286 RepID=A0A511K8K1_RHOTO|nr:AP-3 complex subunit delta-1 [Rhodotorula toruloides]